MAANVRRLRNRERLTLDELSARMSEAGRPILASGLSKIEQGQRSVDVDDLMALAVALRANPNALLLPAKPDADHLALTDAVETPWWRAWSWACGDQPFDAADVGEQPSASLSALAEWFETTKPHRTSDEVAAEVMAVQATRRKKHEDLVDEVRGAQQRWKEGHDGER